jgi:hypothetical protein
MASIAMRAVMSAASALQSEDPAFKHQQIQQFVTAGLVGNGVKSFEAMTELGIPIVIDPMLARRPHSSQGVSPRDLREDVIAQRVEKAVCRIYANQGRPLPDLDSVTFQFFKMRVSNIVATHIRKQGLCVYTHKLLFSPVFEQIGIAVLKEMKQPEEQIAPSTASAAVANGLLPALPSRNLKDHLLFLNSQPMRGWGMNRKSFAQWVKEYAPTVVEFPAPNLKPGESAREDSYRASPYSNSAQLGFGFFLATKHDQVGDRILIVTPTLFNSRRAGAPEEPWRPEFLSKHEILGFMRPEEHKRLKDALEDFGRQSARLNVCPTCTEIYSDDRDDLKLRCNCACGNKR